MNKSKNHSDKLFSWKSILAYLKYDRKGKDAHKLEKAASEDPFLSDAMEGYEAFKHDPIHTSRLKEIENYIQYRKSQEKAGTGNTRRILAIAASITVLISASLWVWISLINPVQNQNVVDVPKNIPGKEKTIEPEKIQNKAEEMPKPIASENFEDAVEEEENLSEIEAETKEEGESDQKEKQDDELFGAKLLQAEEDAFIEEDLAVESSKEFNSEDLINRILSIEIDFWKDFEKNQLAVNDMEQSIMAEEAAPASPEAIRSARKESKSKKKKSKENTIAGTAATEPMTSNDLEIDEAPLSIPDIVENLMQKKEVKKLDSLPYSNDIELLKALNYLYKKDTSKALIQLKKASPRNIDQRILIDSLVGHLNQ
ncbi:hypothetical protein HZR84_01380 [Hyphobacterium sp. CCMP332]|nr:hypothetical protein HZR84_01380 [Hyphobacterium sp. CCMP332]